MPKGRIARAKKESVKRLQEPSVSEEFVSDSEKTTPSLLTVRNLILLCIFILIVFLWKFKGYFIAATVNGQPIPRWDLTSEMTRRFGEQTLDNMINERLVLSAIRQKGIFITTDEINTRVKQVEDRLAGRTTLSEALKAQGLTMDEFRRQVEIQLAIDKMFDKETTVSSQEIDDYLSKNESAYKSATNPAQVRDEVKMILRQQKIGDLFDKWFSDVRGSAKIQKFL